MYFFAYILDGIFSAFRAAGRLASRVSELLSKGVEHLLVIVVRAVGICLILAGIAIFGLQCLVWLRVGHWEEMGLSHLLVGTEFYQMAYSPTDWQGLASILRWVLDTPLSLASLLTGVVAFVLPLRDGN